MGFHALISYLLVLALLPLQVLADTPKTCHRAFAGITIEKLHPNQIGTFSLDKLFGPGDHVAFGVTPGGHAYLMVNDMRFEGAGIAAFPPFVRSHHKGMIESVNAGSSLFYLTNLAPKTADRLKRAIMKTKPYRSFTCYHTICRLLDEGAGIKVHGIQITPDQIIKALAKSGVTIEGKPVEVKVFEVGRAADVNKTMSKLLFERNVGVALNGGIVMAITMIGGIIYFVNFHLPEVRRPHR